MFICLQDLPGNQEINLAATRPGKLPRRTQDYSSKMPLLPPPAAWHSGRQALRMPAQQPRRASGVCKEAFWKTPCPVMWPEPLVHFIFQVLSQRVSVAGARSMWNSLERGCPAPSLQRRRSGKKGAAHGPAHRVCGTLGTVGAKAACGRQILARIPCRYSALTFQIKCFQL